MMEISTKDAQKWAERIVAAAPPNLNRRANDVEIRKLRSYGQTILELYGAFGMDVVMELVEEQSDPACSACNIAWDGLGDSWFA